MPTEVLNSADVSAFYPLTEAQKGVYLECVSDPESLMYNIPTLCRLPKDTDLDRFGAAICAAVKAHKALHVTFSAPNGVPSMCYCEKDVVVPQSEVSDFDDKFRSFCVPLILRKDLCSVLN